MPRDVEVRFINGVFAGGVVCVSTEDEVVFFESYKEFEDEFLSLGDRVRINTTAKEMKA